jgi:hypothetical protein
MRYRAPHRWHVGFVPNSDIAWLHSIISSALASSAGLTKPSVAVRIVAYGNYLAGIL